MPNALKQQVEWFRLFLDSYCLSTYFPTEVDEEMRRMKISRPEVMAVIDGCRIVACDFHEAGVTALTLEDQNCDDEILRVSVAVENDILRVRVVKVQRSDGD